MSVCRKHSSVSNDKCQQNIQVYTCMFVGYTNALATEHGTNVHVYTASSSFLGQEMRISLLEKLVKPKKNTFHPERCSLFALFREVIALQSRKVHKYARYAHSHICSEDT